MCLKLRSGALAAAVVSAGLMTGTAWAGTSDFLGNWLNTDPNTTGITRVIVTPAGPNHPDVHVFGQCHPTDCDWGIAPGHGYADTPGSHDVRIITASFNAGFARKLLILRLAPSGDLRVQTLTDFTDGSGRTDYEATSRLTRVAMFPGPLPIPPGPVPGPGPGPITPVHPPLLPLHPLMGSEDCIGFNPIAVSVANVGGVWKVVQGSMWMLDFGANHAAADHAANVIHAYHFDQQCFVKRPNAAMMYWKAGAHVPSGGLPGQDCVGLNPAAASIANIGGSWKVVDGSHWVLDYGPDETAANQALAVIRNYHLNRQCFIERPNAEMKYWLAQ
jgi:hypothetical protein